MSIYIRENQLSPEAVKQLHTAPNKSLFVREAIEFYVKHGLHISNELSEIKELLTNVLKLSTFEITPKISSEKVSITENFIEIPKEVPKEVQKIENNVQVQKDSVQVKNDNYLDGTKNVASKNKSNEPESDITDEQKKEIEMQVLKSLNMFF